MKKFGGVLGIALMALVLVLTPMGTSMADNQKGWYVGLFAGYVIPSDLELEPFRRQQAQAKEQHVDMD